MSDGTVTRYSIDDEDFDAKSLAALIDAHDLGEGDEYFEIKARTLLAADFTGEHEIALLIDQLEDALHDKCDLFGVTHFRGATAEARAELVAALAAWIDKHRPVATFWRAIGLSSKRRVTAQDLAVLHNQRG